MNEQPRVPLNKLEAGKKYFSRRTSVDCMVFLLTRREEKGLFLKWINVSSGGGGMFVQTGKKTIIYPSEYRATFPNAYVLRRKHYAMIFDMLFK